MVIMRVESILNCKKFYEMELIIIYLLYLEINIIFHLLTIDR